MFTIIFSRGAAPSGYTHRMPYPSGHREKTRERVLKSAQALFQRRGLERVSIRDVMADAGLTHGSFYRYFRSKSDLYAQVVALCYDFAGVRGRDVVRAYLSRRHLENAGRQCPLIALPSDVARSDPEVKRAFEAVFRQMTECLARDLKGDGSVSDALVIAGMCIGAMTVSRAIEDPVLATMLREETLVRALQFGGWIPGSREKRRPRAPRHIGHARGPEDQSHSRRPVARRSLPTTAESPPRSPPG